MSDLNTAFIDVDFASVSNENLEIDVDGTELVMSVKEEESAMTTCLGCVWEAVQHIDSKTSESYMHRNESHESEVKSELSLKPSYHVKQKNDLRIRNKRKANNTRKKFKHCLSEKTNLNYGNDSCLLVEKDSVQVHDGNQSSVVSSVTYAAAECVENDAYHLTELSARLDYAEEERVGDDDGVNLLQTAPHTTSLCPDLVGLSGKSMFTEISDENKNILDDEILLEKECQEKMEILKNVSMFNCYDSVPDNSSSTVQCTVNNIVRTIVAEQVPSIVEEDIFASEQQAEPVYKKNKRRRSLRIMARMEQAAEHHDLDGFNIDLSAAEEHVQYTESTDSGIQDAHITVREDQPGFVKDTPDAAMVVDNVDIQLPAITDIGTTQCSPSATATVHIFSQCLADDFDDIADFPIFTRPLSKRLRRTSMEIYRKSLHNAENIASEEECDTVSSVPGSMKDETAATEMNLATDDVSSNEPALLPIESNDSITLPTTAVENVDIPSNVQLPAIADSNDIANPTTDSSLANITNSQRRCRRAANSQVSLNMPIIPALKTRQRNSPANVQDIYLNRLWRSQMPKEKALESVPEVPTPKQCGSKVTKRIRCLKFDDAPNKTKLRLRRQKALKNGWKPISKKQSALLDGRLSDKLAEIETDLM